MTEEEDSRNAAENEHISACRHDPYRCHDGKIACRACGCLFAVVLKRRLARPPVYDFDDDE